MTLDIRGSLKNTKINRNPYVVIDELLSNAIDSYLHRKNSQPTLDGLKVLFDINFFDRDLEGKSVDLEISCTDNGNGLGDAQTKAFVTKDTSFKDDLAISGIGKCKGAGRVQFFHYFSRLQIDSIYATNGKYFRRTLNTDDSIKEIDPESFKTEEISPTDLHTTFSLKVVKPDIYEKLFTSSDLRVRFAPSALKAYVFISFMQRLIGLKQQLGKFEIKFNCRYKENGEDDALTPKDLPAHTAKKDVTIYYLNETGLPSTKTEVLHVFHYKLDGKSIRLRKNTVALCGKSTIVKDVTSNYLKTKKIENNPIDGFYHIVLVESDYLDKYVNEQRDGFDIPDKPDSNDLFLKNLISLEEVLNAINEDVMVMLTPPDWDKDVLVGNVGSKYGISQTMITETSVRVHYGDTEETVAKRVLNYYQQEAIKDTSEIFDIKEEIAKAEPHSEDFRKKVNELAWKYTASLKNIDMANLSQLVVRRAAMLEILEMAISQHLNVQSAGEERRIDEKLIHNIFFPMQQDSDETRDHDIWILNEEYQYFEYIASDKPLSKIRIAGEIALFEPEVDTELQKILLKRTTDNKAKRPDIAIFNKEGAAIIIEFKAPGVSMDDHVGDLMEYAHLLAAKSNGRIKKFYGYLIGTLVNPLRLGGIYRLFASGKGYFGTSRILDPVTGQDLGELYSEILFYRDVVDRAKRRLDVYKERLDLRLT